MNQFERKLAAHQNVLKRATLQSLQINVGRRCNQACRHCHVDAAPWRTEMMDHETALRIAPWIVAHRPAVVDITGGAPELSDHFRFLVETARSAGSRVIDRCNLTILEEPGFEWLIGFLALHNVEIIASLPCYSPENVNRQRGNGVFDRSIRALKKLNAAGYGSHLDLHLVYNPLGPTLPGPQSELEADYKQALRSSFGIEFHQLYTITNQPIARFAEDLRKQGRLEEYLELLAQSFNPATVEGLMCRSTLSVGWRGEIYDCDFNQMLGMQLRNGRPLYLWDMAPDTLGHYPIQTGDHCLACTAGCGSSCTGATTSGNSRV
ncbi:MAG: radical SAM/Cys-rich domain protein [Pedosphaera sp.]|nr:radical SAM/Cys-rich domain protein [Pedosphaera sp.]